MLSSHPGFYCSKLSTEIIPPVYVAEMLFGVYVILLVILTNENQAQFACKHHVGYKINKWEFAVALPQSGSSSTVPDRIGI